VTGSSEYPVGIVPMAGGGLVVGATTTAGDESWVLALDASGVVLWQWRFPAKLRAIGGTPDGGVFTCTDSWLTRFDGDGAVVWQRNYTDEGGYNQQAVLSDGGFATWMHEIAYMDPDGWMHYRMFIEQMAADGDGAWSVSGDPGWEWSELSGAPPGRTVLPLPGGRALLSWTWDRGAIPRFGVSMLDADGGTSYSGVLAGTEIWAVDHATSDSSVPIAGRTGESAWLAVLEMSGAIRWQRSIDFLTGSATWSVASAPDGGALFLGYSSGPDDFNWLAKLGPNGEFGGSCPALACPAATLEPSSNYLTTTPFDGFAVGRNDPLPGSVTVTADPVGEVQPVCPE
jgi:hypothetical protein